MKKQIYSITDWLDTCRMFLIIGLLVVAFILPEYTFAQSESNVFSVKKYGAKGDGKTLDTKAIQAAVDAAAAKGGGIVLLTPGNYISGTIVLKSYVRLRVEAGATLLGSIDMKDYPEHIGLIDMIPGVQFSAPLIYAENASYVGIEGKGTIDGRGTRVNFAPLPASDFRPGLVRFNNCRFVTLEDIHLTRPARWTLHLRESKDVNIKNISISSRSNRNNDGIDIDGCQRVNISGSTIDTEDDAIVLKSYRPGTVRDIVVSNCILTSWCYAFKIGTETLGNVENVTVSNCIIYESHGIALQSMDGAEVSNINISNITMNDCFAVLELRLGGRLRDYSGKKETAPLRPGKLRNVTISNIQAGNVANSYDYICGIPGYSVENVTLDNIRIHYKGNGTKQEANATVPEQITGYPKWTLFGTLPSYGFYIRHVKGISLNNVNLSFENPDLRPAIYCDKVSDLFISASSFMGDTDGEPLVKLRNTSNAVIQSCFARNKVGVLVGIEGSETERTLLDGNLFFNAKQHFSQGEGVTRPSVR